MNPNDNSYKSYNLEASFNFSQEDLRELFNQTKLGHGRHFSEVTIKNYLADISHLGDWFVKEFHRPATAQEVTAEILKLFKDYLSGKKYSPRTIERHLSSIRTLFKVLKKQGIVAKDPTQKPAVDIEQKDAWHIRQFKDYLYVFGAADLTIKNYITDLRHFLGWVDQAVLASDFNSAEQYRFEKLIEVLPLYRQRLVKITNLAPASIKRKLSGIRKFLLWSAKEGFIRKELVETPRVPTAKPAVAAPVVLPAPNQAWTVPPAPQAAAVPQRNVLIHLISAPLRLSQTIFALADAIFEHQVVTPLTNLFINLRRLVIKEPASEAFQVQSFYAPPPKAGIQLPPILIAIFVLVLLFVSGLTIFQLIFNRKPSIPFVNQPGEQQLATATTRRLAFAGKLTDDKGNAVTKTVSVKFTLYPTETSTGLLWQETQDIKPNSQGEFSTVLGNKTPLSTLVFIDNETLWLGITVEGSSELKPRAQVPNVELSRDTIFVRGKEAGTEVGPNMVPILDSEGNLNLAARSPSIVASSGTLTLQGEALTLTTVADGDITIAPKGTGNVDIQGTISNTSDKGEIAGAVNIADSLSVVSTSSSSAALTVRQDSSGDLFSLNLASTSALVVKNSGLVGLGTVTPRYALDVVGDIGLTGDLFYSGDLSFFGSSGTESARLTSAGRFGLGTTSPLGKLHVSGAVPGKALVILDETGDQNVLTASASGTTKFYLTRTGNIGFAGELDNITGSTVTVIDDLKIQGTTLTVGNGAAATIQTTNAKLTLDSGSANNITLGSGDALNISGNFAQTGSGTFSTGTGAVSLNGAVTATSTLGVTGATTLSSTLGVTGATTLSSTLDVTGATTLASTLAVTGNTTLTGDLAVNGGDLTTTSTTFNLINTTATTLNIGGAATTVSIGATTGTTTVNNALTVTGATTLSSTLGVTGDTTLTGALTANGNVTLGNATSDTITATGRFSSSLVPSADNTYDLGSSSLRWANLYVTTVDTTGNIAISNTNPTLTFTDTTASEDDWNINVDGSALVIRNTTDTANYFTLSGTGDLTLTQDLAVNGGDLTTSATTFNLLNATATTVNFAGAATTLSLGASTGTTTINNDLIVSGGDITGTGDESIDIGEATTNAITFLIDAAGEVILTSSALSPSTSDGNALGTTALMWSDLFLASGGVINFNNGDVTLTHSTDTLTIAGATTLTATDVTAFNCTDCIDFDDLVDAMTIDAATTLTYTGAGTSLALTNSGAKTAASTGISIANTSTSSTASINKVALALSSTGTWDGTSAYAIGLEIQPVTGGTNNVGLCFDCDGTWTSSTVASGIQFGTDAAAVSLYRSADNTLRTGDNLTVDLDLIVSGGDITGTGDESIDIGEATANQITFLIDATAELSLSSSALFPSTDSGLDLGTSTSQFADLYLDGGNINLDNATDIDIDDNTASALTISEGSNNYLVVTTTDTATAVTLDLPVAGSSTTTGNLFTANTTKTINIGTGTAADTINIGTGATTADVITLGNTGVATTFDFNSGAATVDAFDITTNSITTANAVDISATALTTGNALNITTNSTASGLALNVASGAVSFNEAGVSTAAKLAESLIFHLPFNKTLTSTRGDKPTWGGRTDTGTQGTYLNEAGKLINIATAGDPRFDRVIDAVNNKAPQGYALVLEAVQGGAINNRQLNSSFESGAPPSDWTADAGLTVTQDSTYSIHKTYSAKLVADTSDRRYYQSRACTGYDPVGVYARLSDGSAVSSSNVVLLSRNDDTVSGASTTYTKITQDGWYRLGSRGATSGTCRYGVVVKANQTVWIDAYQQGDSNSENLVGHYVEATDATTTMGADQGLTYSTTNNFYKDQGTISFWYQNWDLNARGYVFGESGGNWEIRFQNGNTPLFTPDNATTSVTGSAMPNWNGTWQYMVITWDSSNIKIYQDGVQTGTTTAPASYTAIGASMGVGHTPEGSPFNNYTRCDCALSDFAIFNRALTATEVSQIYNSRAPLQDNFSNVAVVAQEATTGNMLSQPGGIFLASTATTVTANQLAANSLTSGTGLTVSSTATDVSSGTLFSLSKTGASGSTAFTGDIANIAYSQTFNGGTGLTSSGNVLDVSRAITLNNTGQTHTISGALVTIADSGTETAGDINNTSNVLNLAQNCGTGVTCSGAVLKIVNSGTGADISLANAETISNSTNGQINFGADKLDLDTTATSGNLLNISYDAAMTQAGALYGGYFDLFTNVTTGNNNQTGVYVKTRDGGASSTVVGLTLDGTADRGIDLSALNISTGGSILYNDTDSTIDLAATANNTLTIANSSGTTVNDNIVTLAVDANTDAADKILFRIISDVGGANTTVASIDSEGDIIANSITASQTHCTDCLDFADFVDAMTLDANLTLAQTTYTWTQTFTGTSGVGLTYNADSLTTGTVIKITSGDGLTTGGELIDLVADSMQSGGLITGSATALTSGYFLSFTGPSAGTVGVTGNIISLTSDVGNAGSIFKSTATFDSTAASASSYNIYASTTNSNATNANSAYGAYLTLSDAVALGNSDYGIYSTVTNTGANTLGTKNAYGVYGTVSNTSGGVGGSSNAYGGYFTATGDTGGTSTAYGIYATASGADTNYPAYFVTSQPTAVSGATGTNADALIGLSSAAGGNTTIATTGTGGVGSGLAWTLGTGGTAASANTASTGGAGGAYSLTSGTGGAAAATGTNIGGAGGAISLTGGTGGAASGGTGNTGGAGGAIDIVAGAAGSGGNANGGTLTLNSGAVTGSGTSTISIGSANVTTLNLGSANTTKTVNLGTGTGADTINIGTGATTADAITLGNTGVATTIDINSGAATVNALDITTDSVTTATALALSVDALTTGKGLDITSTSNVLDSGVLLNVSSSQTAATDTTLSADTANISFSPTYSTAVTTPAISGNVLDISRSTTTNSLFASTLTVSGALVSISDTSTQTTGTLTHSADVLALTQNYGTTTGAILSLTPPSTTNAGGALEAINIGSITTSSGTDLALTFGTGWDTDINATTSLEIGIGGTNELTLTATALSPSTDSGSDLGTSSSQFADLYLDGGNINLDNATDIDIDDNTASALTVTAGADTYFLITTSTGAEVVTLNNIEAGTMNIGTTNVTRTLNLGTGTEADTINIGTGGTTADTITIGNNASSTSLALTSGTGSQTFTSNVATGTTTTSGFVFDATAITSGTGLYLVTDSVTTGKLLDIATSGNTWTGNGTTNGLVNLASTSTAGTASSSDILLNIARSGANSNTAHTAYGIASSVTNTGTTSVNVGGLFTATGATTNRGLEVAAMTGATSTGLTVGALSGTTANTGVTIGAISGASATGAGITVGNISTTGTTNYGMQLGTMTGGTTSNYQISTGVLTSATTTTNAQVNLGGVVTTGGTTNYGVNVGALSGTGTTNYGVNINTLTSTGTTNYGLNIGGATGAATTNYGLYIGAVSGSTTNYSIYTNGGTVYHAPTQTVASAASATLDAFNIPASTITVSGSTNITTATGFNLVNIGQPTLSNASIAVSNAATLYIANAPTASGGGSITNPYALWVDAGDVRFDGDLDVQGGDITTTATTFNLINATATTLNIGGAATTVSIGASTGTFTVNNATFNCTDCINFDDLSDSLTIDAATSITADSGFTSTTPLTYNANFITTGTALLISADALTTGKILDIDQTNTYTANTTISGNELRLTRALTVNDGAATLTVSGAVASFSSNCTQTLGTCTDSGNILSLTQSYASATGAVLNISNAGTGMTIQVSDDDLVGLGTSAGRIEFDDTTIDEINFLSSRVGLGTQTPTSVLHVDQAAETTTAALFARTFIDNTNAITTNTGNTDVYGLQIDEPNITVGTATPTNSASLYISAAATEASNNYALWVDAGASRFDGQILAQSGNTVAAPSYSINGDTDTGIYAQSADRLDFAMGGVLRYSFTPSTFTFERAAASGGAVGFSMPSVVHTAVTAEKMSLSFPGDSLTITGEYALQRFTNFPQGVITAASALNVTTAATVNILGSVSVQGSATVTNNYALRIGTDGAGSGTTNAYGLGVAAPTGATNNYAATFTGGNVGVGTAQPGFALQVAGNIGPNAGPTIAATTQTATTIDTTGTVGTYNGAVIGPDGFPIVYNTRGGVSIRITKCGNASCSSGNTTTSAVTGNVYGNYGNNIALGADGLPVLVYMIDGADGIYVLKCGNLTCSSGNTNTRVFAGTAAYTFALAIGTDGFPVIIYRDIGTGQDDFIKCSNASCSSSTEATNVTSDTTARNAYSLAIGTDGFPIFSFKDSSNALLRITHCGNASCSSGNTTTTIDSNGNTNDTAGSIAIGADGLAVVAYQDSTNGDLEFVKCGNTACSSGNLQVTIESANVVGAFASVAIGADGLPFISYFDDTNNDLRVAKCSNLSCSSSTITSIDTTNDVGQYTVAVIGADGLPFIVFYDFTAGNLDARVIKCATISCSAASGTALSGGGSLGGWMPSSNSFGSAFETLNTYQIANPSTFRRLSLLTAGTERMMIDVNGEVGIGTTTPGGLLDVSRALTGAAPGLTAPYLSLSASTFTDQSTAASGTATNMVFNSIAAPTLAASNTSVTTTNAATFYIANAPTAGTNMTITNPYALWVDAGNVRLDGTVIYQGTSTYIHNTGGTSNFFAGVGAGNTTLTGTFNTAVGANAGNAITSGGTNTLVGRYAGSAITTGGGNNLFGYNSGINLTTGSNNSFFGDSAGQNNTTGSQNTFLGSNVAASGTITGTDNTAVGHAAASLLSTGNYNTYLGAGGVGRTATTASNRTIVGYAAGYYSTGADNTFIGYTAGQNTSTGINNTFLGSLAGNANTTGSNNILIGYAAGDAITSGANNLVIGYDVDAPSATASNQMTIGNLIFATGVDGTGTTLSTGSVGIGDASPDATFDVTSTATTTIAQVIDANSLTTGTALQVNTDALTTGQAFAFEQDNRDMLALTDKDLTVGGHTDLITQSNITNTFVYDTSKDMDGGKWVDDERARSSSWYNETIDNTSSACVLDTNDRCGQRAFPKKAILIATTTKLYIYDAKDNTLWMDFRKGSGATTQMIGPTTNSTGSSVFALNGKVYYGNAGSVGGLFSIDFKTDSAKRHNSTNTSLAHTTISNRNATVTWRAIIQDRIGTDTINAIHGNYINGKTYIVLLGNTSIVNIISEDDNRIFNRQPVDNNRVAIWLDKNGDLWSLTTDGKLVVMRNIVRDSLANDAPFDQWRETGTTYNGTLAAGPALWSSATTATASTPDALYITDGTSTVDGKSPTVYIAHDLGLTVLNTKRDNEYDGSAKYYTNTYITEEMAGDIRTMTPMIETASLTTSGTDINDRSYQANRLMTNAITTNSITSATGAVRGTGLTLDGTDDYLCADTDNDVSNVCDDNADFDFTGTQNFTIGIWFKHNTISTTEDYLVTKGDGTVQGYKVWMDASGDMCFGVDDDSTWTPDDQACTSAIDYDDNNWHHLAAVKSGQAFIRLYIDGQEVASDTSLAATGTLANAGALNVGADSTPAAGTVWAGSVDEFFITAEALTVNQIKKMASVGQAALQNHTSSDDRDDDGTAADADTLQNIFGSTNTVSSVAVDQGNSYIYLGTKESSDGANDGGVSVLGVKSDSRLKTYSIDGAQSDDDGTAFANDDIISLSITGAMTPDSTCTTSNCNSRQLGGTLVIGTDGDFWAETKDISFQDFIANSFNPFGETLHQTNLSVSGVFEAKSASRLDLANQSGLLGNVIRLNPNARSAPALDFTSRGKLGNNIIDVVQDNRTILSLNDKDLTVGGHTDRIPVTGMVQTFVYDTSKDPDGGKWTDDDRARASSWYNEAIGVAGSRGYTRAFPKRAIIVLTDNTGTDSLYIFDAKDNTLWMGMANGGRFLQNSGIRKALYAYNGKVYVSSAYNSTTDGGIMVADFINDRLLAWGGTNMCSGQLCEVTNNGFSGRGLAADGSLHPILRDSVTNLSTDGTPRNSLQAQIVNGKSYIAAAADSSVVLINETDQVARLYSDVTGDDYNAAWLDKEGNLWALNETQKQLELWKKVVNDSASEINGTPDKVWDQASTPALTNTEPTIQAASPQNLFVTDGTSTVDGKSQTVYVGTDQGVTVVNTNRADESNSSVKYITKDWISEEMVGDVRGMWHLTDNAASATVDDVTLKANDLTLYDDLDGTPSTTANTTTVTASGVRGKGFDLNGTTNFLYRTDDDFNFTDGAFTISMWINPDSFATNSRTLLTFGDNGTVGTGYDLELTRVSDTAATVTFKTYQAGPASQSTTSTASNIDTNATAGWYHIAVVRSGTSARIYVNGHDDTASAGSHTNPADATGSNLVIGAKQNGASQWYDGQIDEVMITAEALNPSQIQTMYNSGHLAVGTGNHQGVNTDTDGDGVADADTLQQLAGSSNTIRSIAVNNSNSYLAVATNDGSDGGAVSIIGVNSDTREAVYSTDKAESNKNDDNGVDTLTDDDWISVSFGGNFKPPTQLIGTGISYAFTEESGGDSQAERLGGTLVIANTAEFFIQTQDVSFQDFMANNYNPFGETLFQSNMNVNYSFSVGTQWLPANSTSSIRSTEMVQNSIFRVDNMGDVILGANNNQANGAAANKSVRLTFNALDNSATPLLESASLWYDSVNNDIRTNAASGITTTQQTYDIAEDFPTRDSSIEAGDVVAVDKEASSSAYLAKSNKPYQSDVIGIVSTNPGFRLSQEDGVLENPTKVALAGRVPVKVSTENGPIEKGDYLTSSSTPGVAMRATRPGPTIGKALEAFSCNSVVSSQSSVVGNESASSQLTGQQTTEQLTSENGQPKTDNGCTGKILAFVNLSWYDPDVYLTDTGDLHLVNNSQFSSNNLQSNSNDSLTNENSLEIKNWKLKIGDEIISRIGAFSEAAIANLRAGLIQSEKIVSPLAEIDTIHTNIISPLASDSIRIHLGGTDGNTPEVCRRRNPTSGVEEEVPCGGKLIVENASGSAVAIIDDTGNASFSGQLSSNQLTSNEATITGTLRANKIVANEIEGLEARLSTVSAQYITNVTNVYEATQSSVLGSQLSDSSQSGNLITGQLATENGQQKTDNSLDISQFSASFATFRDGLMAFGPSSFADVSISGTFSVGANLFITDTSLDTLAGDLVLQGLRNGGISFVGGQVYIDKDGNITAKGNVYVEGNLIVKDASDSAVLKINQQGDLTASGSGTFNKLNLFSSPVLALSDTEAVATSSAGQANIKRGRLELTINTPLVNTESLIYVTGVATDSARPIQTPYLLRQIPEQSFTVGVDSPAVNDIPFNWLIIN